MDPKELVDRAAAARQNAYAPYSGYPVGAAVMTASGAVYAGCNVENASSGLTVCAERTAIQRAVSQGDREITALAVVTEDGVSPCGACRQVLQEFANDAEVFLASANGAIEETTLGELLPSPFTRRDL
jgi:cytidine deaminase